MKKNSQIPKFYKRTISERQEVVKNWGNLKTEEVNTLNKQGLSLEQANQLTENVIGTFNLPLSIATNFKINDKDYLIPMVIEEPSVVAACSFAAKLFRETGGFTASSDQPIMIGQIQILDISDIKVAIKNIKANKETILKKANEKAGSILKRGGGAVDLEIRHFERTSIGNILVIHLLYNTQDAMGANAINTAVEYIAPYIEETSGGRVNLRILSNLTDKRKAYAQGTIDKKNLTTKELSGEQVIDSIIEASVLAEVDPYRATTHNKGIMNGIDAVLLATANDWRAVDAGAHAYAARNGSYTSLTKWSKDDNGNLKGEIELPLAVGIIGGATRVHPTAQIALKILDIDSARELAEVIASVGLAQNFAAIRALATEGIQHGHMRMHARQLAIAAGATPESVMRVTQQMITEKNIRLERAKELVRQHNESKSNES